MTEIPALTIALTVGRGALLYSVQQTAIFVVGRIEIASGLEIFLRVIIPTALDEDIALKKVPFGSAIRLSHRVEDQLRLGISALVQKLTNS